MVFIPLQRKVGYDPKMDFSFIIQIVRTPSPFSVRKDNPANSWKEWIEWAKKNVDKATYSTPGPGGVLHLIMLEIFQQEKINPPHVPYESGAACISAVIGGHVNAVLEAGVPPHIESGQFKALAVGGDSRLRFIPEVPTFHELGYQSRANTWYGLCAPAKTPAPILKKLEEAFSKAANEPAFTDAMAFMELILDVRDGPAFKKILEDDINHFGPLLKTLGLEVR